MLVASVTEHALERRTIFFQPSWDTADALWRSVGRDCPVNVSVLVLWAGVLGLLSITAYSCKERGAAREEAVQLDIHVSGWTGRVLN